MKALFKYLEVSPLQAAVSLVAGWICVACMMCAAVMVWGYMG